MDLWVTEPSGERCDYSHDATTIGGLMSEDFTAGYGPEVYAVRRAMRGTYRLQAEFYGSDAQALTGPTTVQAVVVTDYGRPGERRRAMTLRLSDPKDAIEIGTVRFTSGSRHAPR
jgi:Ca-activated chloride channel family protein